MDTQLHCICFVKIISVRNAQYIFLKNFFDYIYLSKSKEYVSHSLAYFLFQG